MEEVQEILETEKPVKEIEEIEEDAEETADSKPANLVTWLEGINWFYSRHNIFIIQVI